MTLIRYNKIRILYLRLYITPDNGSQTYQLSEIDRPTIASISGAGIRRNSNNTGICIALISIDSLGWISFNYVNAYNVTTPLGMMNVGDKIDGTLTWIAS